jgi:chemotaxis family two-component system sensor histidine kinase/response regulator PixL
MQTISQHETIQDEGYVYFLTEAPELLQNIEQGLLDLQDSYSIQKVHGLMRSAHNLKGAAASVGLDTIKTVAHYLEDVFKALYNPEVNLDKELEQLLFEGYECLREPLMAEVGGTKIDSQEILERAAEVFASCKEKLGDFMGEEARMPTAAELGFDITLSIFEAGVTDKIVELQTVYNSGDLENIKTSFTSQAEVFVGLAESLNLPGFLAISRQFLSALNDYPQDILEIAGLALDDWNKGKQAVLAGDRTQGGSPSAGWSKFGMAEVMTNDDVIEVNDLNDSQPANLSAPSFAETNSEDLDLNLLDLDDQPDSSPEILNGTGNSLNNNINNNNLNGNVNGNLNLDQDLDLDQATTTNLGDLENSNLENGNLELDLDDIFGDVEVSGILDNTENAINLDEETSPIAIEPTESATNTSTIPSPVISPATSSNTSNTPNIPPPASPANSVKSVIETLTNPVDPRPSKTSESNTNTTNKKASENKTTSARSNTTTGPSVVKQSVRIDLEKLDSLNHLVGELLINQNRIATRNEQLLTAVKELVSQLKQEAPKVTVNVEEVNTEAIPESQVEDVQPRHNILKGSPAEMIKVLSQLVTESNETAVKQQRLLLNLRDDLMEARMSPLGELLQRFPRILQQAANSQEKPIDIQISGNDVLSDKSVWDKIYDPLMHLLRNAIAHGIESPDQRRKVGKPERGQIIVHAYNQGTRMVIEITDDGRGINLDKVRQKAIDLEIITVEQARTLSEAATIDLLFEPGFSTAAQVNDLAGRGVGLDVVRSQLQSIKGTVLVRSQVGKGTTFSLQIPIPMTIAKLMVVQAGNAVYAMPSEMIAQIMIPQPDQVKQSRGQRVLYWNERVVPLQKLSDMMIYKSQTQGLSKISDAKLMPIKGHNITRLTKFLSLPTHPVLLLNETGMLPDLQVNTNDDSKTWGLEVEELFGEQELVIKPLGNAIAYPKYIYGCTILGDGSLILVIDPLSLIDQSVDQPMGAGPIIPQAYLPISTGSASRLLPGDAAKLRTESIEVKPAQPEKIPVNSSAILVVDDSETLRKTISSTLIRAGYQVIQAGNGLEAIQKLQQNANINLIISDVEMPEMNGFQFLNHCRQDQSLSSIPVVMLTACRSNEHQQLALALGAAAYLTKPCSQPDLLTTVAQNKLG